MYTRCVYTCAQKHTLDRGTHITYVRAHTRTHRSARGLEPSPGRQGELFIICQSPFGLHFKSKSQMERVATISSAGVIALE